MRVVSIEGGARGTVKIGLDTGSSFFSREAYLALFVPEAAEALSGEELSEAQAEGMEKAALAYRAETKGLELLARAEHPAKLLALKLKKRKFPEEVIEPAIGRLIADGALNESRYAESWLRSRLRTDPASRDYLTAELVERGLAREPAASAVRNAIESMGGKPCLLLAAAKKAARCGEYAKALNRMAKKGFTLTECERALAEIGLGPSLPYHDST